MINSQLNQKFGKINKNKLQIILLAIYSVILIIASEQFFFVNQGDFSRTIGNISSENSRFLQSWPLRDEFNTPKIFEIYSIFIWAIGLLSKLFTSDISIFITSITQKIFLLLSALVIAKNISSSKKIITVYYLLIATVMMLPHNSGVFKSFYPESFFIIGITLITGGLINNKPDSNNLIILLGTILCGLAKVQYFYIPLLVTITFIFLYHKDNPPKFKSTIVYLVFIQIFCLAPLIKNEYAQVNRYHALYLGAYMAMESDDLIKHKITPDKVQCIGVDAWGNKLSGQSGIIVEPNHKTCFGSNIISISDIIHTYTESPKLFISLLEKTFDSHFTTNYFHVYPDFKYLSKTSEKIRLIPGIINHLSNIRSNIPPHYIAFFLITTLIILLSTSQCNTNEFHVYILLLTIASSQIAISLLGEGLRDLSKHLLGVQYIIDLLTTLLTIKILGLVFNRFYFLRRYDQS